MGKVKTRIIGDEETEKKQKAEQKARSAEKKAEKNKIKPQGSKGGVRMAQVETSDESLEKMAKAKKIIEEKPEKKAVKKKEAKPVEKKERGKKYQKAKKQVDSKKSYSISEAVVLLKKLKYADFDESVELHLNVDEQGLKGEVELPNPTGKTFRVQIVDDKVLAEIEKGKLDFDILVTHPQYMPKLAKYAKVLGPKGLMPNPKAGTISPKPEEVVKKFAKGGMRWKTEPKFPLIHQMIGKVSNEDQKIVDNAKKFIEAVGAKHILAAYIKTTMSPSLKLQIS